MFFGLFTRCDIAVFPNCRPHSGLINSWVLLKGHSLEAMIGGGMDEGSIDVAIDQWCEVGETRALCEARYQIAGAWLRFWVRGWSGWK